MSCTKCNGRFKRRDPYPPGGENQLCAECLLEDRDHIKAKLENAERLLHAHVHVQKCANCGKEKPLPYRRDDLGGYVCLTCVETYLNRTLEERNTLKAQLEATAQGAFEGMQALARDNAELRAGNGEFDGMHNADLRAQLHAAKAALEAIQAQTSERLEALERSTAEACQRLRTENATLRRQLSPPHARHPNKHPFMTP